MIDIEIKRISPDCIEDYLDYFENVAHNDNDEEDRCYCICWSAANHKDVDLSSPDVRRKLAVEYINNGMIDGYLAYHNGKIVGWCNANAKNNCLCCRSWLMFMQEINVDIAKKVKSIYCFAISPDYRRMGIATKLLERVCADAKTEGFDFVEAYPRKKQWGKMNVFRNFQGPFDMYKEAGFKLIQKASDKVVVQKDLR